MAIHEPVSPPAERNYRAIWVAAAIIAVMAALGAVHLLGSIPVFGVKAVEESGEMPVEEHPVEPAQ